MPSKIETTHDLILRTLIVYRRERSDIWQCRYKVANTWIRNSTKQADLSKAMEAAFEMYYEAKARADNDIPVVTRKFKHVAEMAIKRLENEANNDRGLKSYNDYIQVLRKYHIPFLGKYMINNIDYDVLDDFDKWRCEEMGKAPRKSTLQTHNAALNRVFEEAITQKYLTELTRPTLAKTSDRRFRDSRRPAFDVEDIPKLLSGFEEWIKGKKHRKSQELGWLLKDYICVLLDTGARPGGEIMNLKWNQVKYERGDPKEEKILKDVNNQPVLDDEGNPMLEVRIDQDLWLKVSGKTGTRDVFGGLLTRKALERIAIRNYGVEARHPFWIQDFLISQNNNNTGFVFRLKDGSKPTSFEHLFDSYLEYIGLTHELSTGKKYVFYSLRHTYATLKLEYQGTPISTLAKHMGTSVQMIEKHYSHLNIKKVKDQLRSYFLTDIKPAFSNE